ncbi:hypothetical protein F2Q69_00047927 [Brassica cretica]|uniref:Uncharacterized protein n=1 Tax=Brassica cretica TaxID=69181 RepID=A0A8S9PXV1_BRACR|nr:hypothetical protein F2Q69_00047927 [Brassica cretica]
MKRKSKISTRESSGFLNISHSKKKNSGGIVRDLEVQTDNALVPVDFHVLDIKLNWNSSLLLRRAFLSTVGAVCNLQTNQLCLTLIDPNAHYDPIPVNKPHTISRRINDAGIIAEESPNEYDEDFEEERAIEYRAILDEEDKLLHHSSSKKNAPSFDMTSLQSIDTQPQQRCRKGASTDTAYYKSVDTDFNRV